MELLKQLGRLRDAGIVTTEEFEAKKQELLARIQPQSQDTDLKAPPASADTRLGGTPLRPLLGRVGTWCSSKVGGVMDSHRALMASCSDSKSSSSSRLSSSFRNTVTAA
ncbi:SHOCT domain-containing protein [Spirillospora sp. NPDC029432]|uniref:SHOCT domain-containing protein n=1 Tax=Spirillospora sp. NPDC029432 TaxID=3154599 RepID=UPI003452ECD9